MAVNGTACGMTVSLTARRHQADREGVGGPRAHAARQPGQ